VNTEIIINGVSVPYLGDPGIGINKKINAEATDIGTRSGNSTYTISIPGSTEGVRTLFNNLFDVNVSQADYSTYTPPRINTRLKAPAFIYQNQLLVFSGYARLSDIVLSEHGKIVFQVVFYSELPDLFASVGEKFLNELDLSAYNHEYNVDNIANSWATSIIENGSPVAFELGNGYVYPMIEYGENNEFHKKPNNWYWHHFKPAVYVKTIIDAIFVEAGIAYNSAFFDSEYFKKLIIPYSNGDFRISEDEVTARQFQALRITTDQTVTINTVRGGTNLIVLNSDVSDPSNLYNTTNGIYQCVEGGNNQFYTQVTLQLRWTGSSGVFVPPNSVNIEVQQRRGGVYLKTLGTVVAGTQWSSQPVNNGDLSDPVTVVLNTTPASFLPGDQAALYPVKPQATAPNFECVIEAGALFGNQVDAAINYNEIINLANTLPDIFKQKDFLAGIIKMFNLYFDDDETKADTLIVEPRPSFYEDLSVDLTNVFDVTEPSEIKPQGLAKYKSYLFKYSEDSDFYNEDYKTRTNETYGQLRVGIANEFVGDEYNIDLPFAPTPLIAQLPTERVLSAIFFKDTSNNIVAKAAKPRIMFYGGLLETTSWNLFSTTGSTAYTSYPYAGHHDTPYAPEYDLLFTVPKLYYFGGAGNFAIQMTNLNLYGLYYYQHIIEINGEDAFTATASFNIQLALFLQMSLRKLYFFQNAYWRLLEMVDYSIDPAGITQCHFIKALEISAPAPVTKIINGGNGDWIPIPGDEVPTPGLVAPPPQGGNGSFGPDNQMPTSGRGVLVVGNGIVLGDDVDSVVVLGGNQPVINSGTVGGVYINVDFTDTDYLGDNTQVSGLTSISGETVFIGGTINVSGDTMYHNPVAYRVAVIGNGDNPYDIITPRLICDNTTDIAVYLPTPTDLNGRNNEYVITKRNISGQVNVYAQGGATIYHSLGVDNPLPLTGRQSITIIWDGVSDWQVTTGP
jgi:hypothetical protein